MTGLLSEADVPQPQLENLPPDRVEPPRRETVGRRQAGFNGTAARVRAYLNGDRFVLLVVAIPITLGVLARWRWGVALSEDTRFYITMALRDKGMHISEAIRTQHALTGYDAGLDYFNSHNSLWRMVQARPIFPLLSAPFVAWLGLPTGMFIVPGIAAIATTVGGAAIVLRLYGRIPALAVGFTIAAGILGAGVPMTPLISALTDGPAVGLLALIMLNLPIGKHSRGVNLVWLAALTLALSLTRQEAPMVCGLVAGGWLWAWLFPGAGLPRSLRNAWLAPAAVVIAVTAAATETINKLVPYDVTNQFVDQSGYKSYGDAMHHLPQILWKIMRPEIAMVFRDDTFLAILLFAPLVLMLVKFKDHAVGMYLGALLGTLVLCVANGVPSYLRYESILYPVAAVGLGSLIKRCQEAVEGRSQDLADPAAVPTGDRIVLTRSERLRVAALAAACAIVLAAGLIWSARHGTASVDG